MWKIGSQQLCTFRSTFFFCLVAFFVHLMCKMLLLTCKMLSSPAIPWSDTIRCLHEIILLEQTSFVTYKKITKHGSWKGFAETEGGHDIAASQLNTCATL